MKKAKRILALWMAVALLALALGAIAEQGEGAGAPAAEPVMEAAEELLAPPEEEEALPAPEEVPEDISEAAPEESPEAAVPDGFVMDGDVLVVYEGKAADVVIPEGVAVIGPVAFAELPELRSVAIPASVKRIESYAFAECGKLECVFLSEGLIEIQDHAFKNCPRLREIALPESLRSIGDEAFVGCGALGELELPEGLESVGDAVFPEEAAPGEEAQEGEAQEPEPDAGEVPALGVVDALEPEAQEHPVVLPEDEQYTDTVVDLLPLTIGIKESFPLNLSQFEGWELSYSNSAPDVVKINEAKGTVTGLKKGTSTIDITAGDDLHGLHGTCVVTVKAAPKGASFESSKEPMGVGQVRLLKLKYSNADAASCHITWRSGNTEVAEIEEGLLKAKQVGKAKITGETFNGKKASFTLTVKPAATAVKLPESLKLCVGQLPYVPQVELEPADALSDILFTSEDMSIVARNDEGALVPMRTGSTKIIALAYNGDAEKRAECPVTVVEAPSGIKITNPIDKLGVGETYTLSAQLAGDEELGAYNTWESDKPKIVKVDPQTGMLTAKKKGTATVKVTSANGLTDEITIQVQSAPKKLSLSAKKGTLGVGETLQLGTALQPKIAASQIRWNSDEPEIAKVENGLVTAVATGKTKIRAKTFNGKSATFSVQVKEEPTGIVVPSLVALSVDQSYKLRISLAPGDAASKLTITNSDATKVKLSKTSLTAANEAIITLKGLEVGGSTLEVETYNGLKASCAVTVYPKPGKVWIENPVKKLGVKDVYQLQAGTADKALLMHCKWKSSKPKVIKVNPQTGVLTAKKKGTAKITVTLPKGKSTVKASVTIRVVKAPDSVTLNPTSVELEVGETAQLEATLQPATSASQLTWTSDDESVATVDAKGLVTGIGGGSAAITATTCNGKTASCAVKVEGIGAPVIRIDGEAAGSTPRVVYDDVELAWSSEGLVQSYSVKVTDENGGTLFERSNTGETSATIAKSDMAPGALYTILVSAEVDVDGQTVSRSRTAQFRYEEPGDFSYRVEDGAVTITGYTGTASALMVPTKLEGVKVTRIAQGAFNGGNCAMVTSAVWPEGVVFEENSVAGLQGCADANGFLVFNDTLCEYFGTAASVKIPAGVIRINDAAFEGKGALTSVEIPNSVETIGTRAFANCAKLKSMRPY